MIYMNILSLFDGISCARVALERVGIPVEAYYASEIDKYAIQISKKNYPDIIQIGDVKQVERLIGDENKCSGVFIGKNNIDLLIGGSPCQDLSIAKKDRKGLDGERSGLFWEYVRILNEVKPKYFILENVNSMPKEAKELITKTLGVEPIMINAALVSAQNRKRLFWTNIPNVTQPEDRGILLKDILEDGEGAYIEKQGKKISQINPHKSQTLMARDYKGFGNQSMTGVVYQYRRTYWRETKGGKVPTLTANMGTGGNNVPYVACNNLNNLVSFSNEKRTKSKLDDGTLESKTKLWSKDRSVFTLSQEKENGNTSQKRGLARQPNRKSTRDMSKLSQQNSQQETEMQSRKLQTTQSKTGVLRQAQPEIREVGKSFNNREMQRQDFGIRKLSCIECERLQGLPDNFTEGISNTQRYKCLGNAFNVDVVAHILSFISK